LCIAVKRQFRRVLFSVTGRAANQNLEVPTSQFLAASTEAFKAGIGGG